MKHSPCRRQLGMLACLTMASFACQQAHAEAHSQLSLGNYQYTLTDLDPGDGIAPSVTWGQGTLTQSLSASTSNGVGMGGGPNSTGSKRTEKSYDVPIGTSRSLTYAGYAVGANGAAMVTSADVPVGGSWSLLSAYNQGFVLSPRTAITFTALAQSTLSVVVPPGSVIERYGRPDNGYFDWAPIQAESTAYLAVGDGPTWAMGSSPPCIDSECRTMDYLMNFMRSYETGEQAKDKLLSLTFSNDSAGTAGKTLSTVAYSYGYATAPLPMVPEPARLAMMCLGLAGLWSVVGRTRRLIPAVPRYRPLP